MTRPDQWFLALLIFGAIVFAVAATWAIDEWGRRKGAGGER